MTCMVLPNTPPMRVKQEALLLALPDTILEEIFIDAPLEVLADARKSCFALAEVVSRPGVMQAHLKQALRLPGLPAHKADLSQLMQQQVSVLRHMQARQHKRLPTSFDNSAVVDIADTPSNARVMLTRPPGLNAMQVSDANGQTLWRIPTPVRESFLVPPRLSGDANAVVYLLPSQGQSEETLYLSRQGTQPTAIRSEVSASITHARFAPYDDRLVVVQDDLQGDRIRCIDRQQARDAHAWRSTSLTKTTAIAYADAPYTLASANHDSRTVQLWDVRKPTGTRSISTDICSPTQLVFAPDGQRLFVGGSGGLTVWDMRAGRAQTCFYDRTCEEIAVAPNGRWIATKEQSKFPTSAAWAPIHLQVYDNSPMEALFSHPANAGRLRFSNDGTRLYVKGPYHAHCLDFTKSD